MYEVMGVGGIECIILLGTQKGGCFFGQERKRHGYRVGEMGGKLASSGRTVLGLISQLFWRYFF